MDLGYVKPVPALVIDVGDKKFYATLKANSSAEAFIQKLNSSGITMDMYDYGNSGKECDLPWELPQNDELITTIPGDISLYQGNKIIIYYDKFTDNLTRLAEIGNVTKQKLLNTLGDGNVTVKMYLEWSE